MIKVLVIDQHPVVVEGCRHLLQNAGFGQVLAANSLAVGYRLFRQCKPEVVVLDLAFGEKSLGGLELIRRLRLGPESAAILVFSIYNDAAIVNHALQVGATGYLVKDQTVGQLVEAVIAVAKGRTFLDHELAVQVALIGRKAGRDPLNNFTWRELQTLSLLAKGKSYREIATSLGVSYKTVANTTANLKVVLRAKTLPELIHWSVVKQLAEFSGPRANADQF